MSYIQAEIIDRLNSLPDNSLQQVLDFIEFLTWRNSGDVELQSTFTDDNLEQEQNTTWLETDLSNLGKYDSYEWQTGEIEAGFPVEIDPQKGIVIVEE